MAVIVKDKVIMLSNIALLVADTMFQRDFRDSKHTVKQSRHTISLASHCLLRNSSAEHMLCLLGINHKICGELMDVLVNSTQGPRHSSSG